jgi:hypothetical protein
MDEMGVSVRGEPGKGVLSTGSFEISLKEGSGNGASFPVEALLGEPGGGGLLC